MLQFFSFCTPFSKLVDFLTGLVGTLLHPVSGPRLMVSGAKAQTSAVLIQPKPQRRGIVFMELKKLAKIVGGKPNGISTFPFGLGSVSGRV
jgi:hypothetical protein